MTANRAKALDRSAAASTLEEREVGEPLPRQ
jgi:hypothetical protein